LREAARAAADSVPARACAQAPARAALLLLLLLLLLLQAQLVSALLLLGQLHK
jgi:hypothetical protein